jgi:hypothetical protein
MARNYTVIDHFMFLFSEYVNICLGHMQCCLSVGSEWSKINTSLEIQPTPYLRVYGLDFQHYYIQYNFRSSDYSTVCQ